MPTNIVRIIPEVSVRLQLEILELVPHIRANDEYLHEIPEPVRQLYANKKIESKKCLLSYLVNDLVDICVSYY